MYLVKVIYTTQYTINFPISRLRNILYIPFSVYIQIGKRYTYVYIYIYSTFPIFLSTTLKRKLTYYL